MALVESSSFPMGAAAPDFTLLDTVSGKELSLAELRGEKGTAVFFICNHCPFVVHVNSALVALATDYATKGIACVAISSNNAQAYPQDGPDAMKVHAAKQQYPFPYLYDETQEVANAYGATCTPDLYVFDADLKAVYHGQLDESRPGNGLPTSGKDMRAAFDALLNGLSPVEQQHPSIGCSIKWK